MNILFQTHKIKQAEAYRQADRDRLVKIAKVAARKTGEQNQSRPVIGAVIKRVRQSA